MADDDKEKVLKILQDILNENLEINRQNTDAIKDSVDQARDLTQEFNLSNEAAKNINKSTRDLSKLNAKLVADADNINNLRRKSTDINKDLEKSAKIRKNLVSEQNEIAKKAIIARREGKTVEAAALQDLSKGLQAQISQHADIDSALQKELEHAKNIENSFGLTGKSLDVINKMTGGALGDLTEIKEASRKRLEILEKENKLLPGIAGKFQGMGIQIKEVGKSIFENMTDPLVIIASLLDYGNQLRDLQRGLGISKNEAQGFREEMSMAAATSGDLLATSKGLMEANTALNAIRGTGVKFSEEQLLDANRLLKTQVMSKEAVGELSRLANVTGQGIREAYLSQIDGVLAAENEHGVRLDIKGVLDATSKVTGQIRAQLGGSSEAMSGAVANAKALGMELNEVAAAGKQMLDFESSISAELEAELLTGKQLNLEKARMAALTGDYVTLANEIDKNVGTFYDYSKLNVLQQDAMAKAMGMTSDQLSDQLLKKADLNALAAEARAEGRDDIAANLEALSAQDKMAASVEKLKGVFGDILGILEPIISGFASLVGFISESTAASVAMVAVLATIAAFSIVSAIAKTFAAFAALGPLGIPLGIAAVGTLTALIGGGVAVAAAAGSMDDGEISPGGMTVNHPKGSIQLNKDDSIIAGTNLGGGNTQSSPPQQQAPAPVIVKSTIQYDSFGANSSAAYGGRYSEEQRHLSFFD